MRRIIMAIVAVGILTLTACNTGKVDEKLTTDTNVKSSGVDINAIKIMKEKKYENKYECEKQWCRYKCPR